MLETMTLKHYLYTNHRHIHSHSFVEFFCTLWHFILFVLSRQFSSTSNVFILYMMYIFPSLKKKKKRRLPVTLFLLYFRPLYTLPNHVAIYLSLKENHDSYYVIIIIALCYILLISIYYINRKITCFVSFFLVSRAPYKQSMKTQQNKKYIIIKTIDETKTLYT